MGIASLILAILSLVITIFGGYYSWIGIIGAIVGVILGAVGRKNPEKRGIATAGMVISIIVLVVALIVVIAAVACVGTLMASGY